MARSEVLWGCRSGYNISNADGTHMVAILSIGAVRAFAQPHQTVFRALISQLRLGLPTGMATRTSRSSPVLPTDVRPCRGPK